MEASLIFVLARAWRLRAGGVSVVVDNVRAVTGADAEFDPEAQFEHSAEGIDRLALLGCEIVRVLHERDRATAGR